MPGVSRFDCYPSDFLNGIIGLSSDEIAAYTVVLMMQYDRGTPVAYTNRERELSVRTGLPRGRLVKAIDGLLASGKLGLSEGALSNGRTTKELEKISERIQKNVENSSEGGEATKKKWERIRSNIKEGERPLGQPNGMPNEGPISPPSSSPPPPLVSEAKASDVRPKKIRVTSEYPEDFERFWSEFPTDANMSKKQASAEWAKLSAENREKAIVSCRPFRSYCSARPDYRPVHANRYLAQGRFEGHAAVAVQTSKSVFVRIGSPQWRAWDVEYRRTRKQSPPVNKEGSGWHFPSEWPSDEARTH